MNFSKQILDYVIVAMLISVSAVVILSPVKKAGAQNGIEAPLSGQDKTLMIEGLRAIKRNDWGRAEKQFSQAQAPLARKLYQWLFFTKEPRDIEFQEITAFVASNPDWPWQGTLALNAEQSIDDKDSNAAILTWFTQHTAFTSDGTEVYLEALHRQGNIPEMRKVARRWWATTLLSTERQSEFYERFGGLLDTKTHVKRWNRLLFANHYTNARVLVRLLPDGYDALTEARIALAEQKDGVNALIEKVPLRLKRDPGLMYERLKWRRRADLNFRAIELLHTAPPAAAIPNMEDWWRERHILTRRFIENKQYDSAYELVSKHVQKDGLAFAQAEFMAGWLALEYVDKPWRAFEHFEALYYKTSTPISRSRGAYWAGKASLALGNKEIADKWFRTAAQHQTAFYGQLALGRLKRQQNIVEAAPPLVLPETRAYFERDEMVQAARLLYKAGMRDETGAFLEALARKTDNGEKYVLTAELAHDLGHRHNALWLAKRGVNKGILMMDHAYPTLLSPMRQVDIEWALVHAIIRQESAFDDKAQSPAGARGLMQLMPATAQEVADKAGVRHNTSWLTARPYYNIFLGARYLAQMLARYDGSYVLAIAAYNGGPGRVDRWLEEFGDPRHREIDYVNWIETIPIYETRNYVQRVLEATYIYRQKLKDVQKSASSRIHVSVN